MLPADPQIIHRLLEVIETEIIPQTQTGVQQGNKIFGAAIIKKNDLSTVIASTNTETENPLWHGEVHTIKKLYEMPSEERPNPKDCIFLATHEPCSLCLSAITWGGYKNFYYLFSYEDSRDSFNIPHDLRILKEVFQQEAGGYAQENYYWKSYDLIKLIHACEEEVKQKFIERVEKLQIVYNQMSEIYQANKGNRDIPLD